MTMSMDGNGSVYLDYEHNDFNYYGSDVELDFVPANTHFVVPMVWNFLLRKIISKNS